MTDGPMDSIDRALRWRLMLGSHADDSLSLKAKSVDEDGGKTRKGAGQQRVKDVDDALEFLYDRAFQQRSHRPEAGGGGGLKVPVWLQNVRELFPVEAARVIERDALKRYGMTELVTDPEILEQAEPTVDLLKAIVQFKHLMGEAAIKVARTKVAAVVEELRESLLTECAPALFGAGRAPDRPPLRTFRNIDWPRTIRTNLDKYDVEEERLAADRFRFTHRTRQRSAWRIIVSVDQSGSMTDNLIHSAVMAAIFAGLPSVSVHLVLWDHRIVDMTEHVNDPLEVLMNVQLGGGTDFLPALTYCAALVENPERTLLVVVSDFEVWGDETTILDLCGQLTGAGVKAVGLCAMDADGRAVHDERFAGELADRGWFVASLTPTRLAHYVGDLLRG